GAHGRADVHNRRVPPPGEDRTERERERGRGRRHGRRAPGRRSGRAPRHSRRLPPSGRLSAERGCRHRRPERRRPLRAQRLRRLAGHLPLPPRAAAPLPGRGLLRSDPGRCVHRVGRCGVRIGVLFRTEMIKVRRRPAFWVAVLALLAALALTYGIRLHASVKHGRTPAPLPEAWEGILLGTGPLPALLAAVALILLTASEFSWRTARQNVIDGLSKNEWFLAKLLLLPFLATVFLGVQ